jgi:tricorn protease
VCSSDLYGVAPDLEVVDDPAAMQDGRDPQLLAAIAQMLKELDGAQLSKPPRPASPHRARAGIPAADH